MNSPLNPRTATAVLAVMLLAGVAQATDADHDGLDDAWQTAYNIAAFTGSADPDGDGRPNLVESLNWSDPTDSAHPHIGWGMVVIGDANGDQLDDAWFAQHSSGGMLTTLGDPDGDNRTNLEESVTGTNPWVVDEPWAYMSNTPTTASGPGSFTLSFRSVAGMSYLIERSADLVTWTNDQQVWGDGSLKAITIATGTADRMFFRVGLQQTNGGGLDTDGDGLLDWYEVNVFGTNPLLADTDGDGLPDGWEAMYRLNAMSAADATADGDADSLNNLDEYDFNFDPRSNDFTAKATQMTYDTINRLRHVTKMSSPTTSFTYDREGNLLTNP